MRPSRFAVLLCLCGACEPGTRGDTRKLADGRSYRIVHRTDHDSGRPAPLLFALHAFATDPANLEKRWGMRELAADRRDWLLAIPEGRSNSHGLLYWNATRACCDGENSGTDDIAYLRAVLADIRSTYAVDAARVFAVGVSNGGFMAQRWACEPGGDLAGVVSISGAGPGPDDPPCTPTRPVRMLEVHGDADTVVRYAGGTMNAAHPSARDSAHTFLSVNGCEAGSGSRREVHRGLFEYSTVDETWSCPKGTVALWTVPGGGHQLRMGIGFSERVLDFLAGK